MSVTCDSTSKLCYELSPLFIWFAWYCSDTYHITKSVRYFVESIIQQKNNQYYCLKLDRLMLLTTNEWDPNYGPNVGVNSICLALKVVEDSIPMWSILARWVSRLLREGVSVTHYFTNKPSKDHFTAVGVVVFLFLDHWRHLLCVWKWIILSY